MAGPGVIDVRALPCLDLIDAGLAVKDIAPGLSFRDQCYMGEFCVIVPHEMRRR